MKIAFLASFRESSVGGESRVALELAEMMAQHGHDVVYICPGEKTGLVVYPNGLNRFYMACVGDGEVVMANVSGKHLRQLHQFLDEFQPDIIHTHTYLLIGVVGQAWALRHNVPFVYTAHELPTKLSDFSQGYPVAKWTKRTFLFKAIVRAFYRHCSAVVAINQSALNDLRQLGYAGKLFQISNGRDLKRLNAYPLPTRDTPTRQLMFIGHVIPRKNQEYLVEVMRYLPSHYELKLVGYIGHHGYHEELLQKVAHYGLKNVEFTGRIDPKLVPDKLAEAHVFLSASVLEVQSLVVIEALAAGKPVVGLSNQTVDEFVDESCGVAFPQNTTHQAFADAVKRVAEAPNYEALCLSARQKVQKHDWDTVINQTISAYQACLDTKPAKLPSRSLMIQIYSGMTSFLTGIIYWVAHRAK
ncbi:MAG: glycosyltransferase family 4 protein [Anaerolineae bacterium]|jgi:glycosyltransferase involved in cell wall biosynthesis|nr:glycosyltransferase family 4 protein [Anaerolineae bacterium]